MTGSIDPGPATVCTGLAVIPDRDRAVVVLPENVALAVAVEVAGADDMPAAGIPVAIVCPVTPLSQIATRPSLFSQRMSPLPLPSKSPMPSRCQLAGTEEATVDAPAGLPALPDRHCTAAAVLQQQVGMPVAVVIEVEVEGAWIVSEQVV